VRSVFGLVAAVAIGWAVGMFTAWAALEANIGFNAVHVGPWVGNARVGGTQADPYTRAELARTGELPVGGGEGITFTASVDSEGRALDARCVYRVAGEPPPARWWTLTAYGPDGSLIDTPLQRNGFTSREVMRGAQGTFSIVVSHRARPGDWLPVGPSGRFILVMRLYDTPLSSANSIVEPVLPDITRERCP